MNYREFSPIFVIGRDETIRLEPLYRRHSRATTLACVSDMTARQPIDNEHVCRNFASSAVFTALFIMVSSYLDDALILCPKPEHPGLPL